MNNQNYWKKRAEEIADLEYQKVEDYRLRMQLEYKDALKSIQRDIEIFYSRFAQNNDISLLEAKKLLNSDELEEFKMDLAEFRRMSKQANPDWEKELVNVSLKTRITRLEALQVRIRNAVEQLYTGQQDEGTELLKDTYEDTYFRNIYNIQSGTGIGVDFAKPDNAALDKVINEKWIGSNYSDRLWKDKIALLTELQTNLAQAFIRGDSIDKTTKTVAGRLGTDFNKTRTLINTESAYIAQKATFDGYKATGVEQYQIVATLDLHTSKLCRSLDLKIFNLSDKEIGVTAPPFHPNCRTTTVAYFDGMMFGERLARDSEGKTYYVDRNMSYEEWYNKYVKGNHKEEVAELKTKNKSSDKKQYEEYKEILGDEAPKTFDKFQELKDNNSNEWNELKEKYPKVFVTKEFNEIAPLFKEKLSDLETRKWYKWHDENIPNLIDKTQSIEDQAKQAHDLRNTYRTQARDLMKNQEERKQLDIEHPNKSFENLIADKMDRKKMTREEAIKDTLKTATKTNKKVNKSLGLE